MEAALSDGFAAVAVARMVLREPGIINRMQAAASRVNQGPSPAKIQVKDGEDTGEDRGEGRGGDVVSTCTHCNLCIVGSTMAETPLVCAEREIEDLIAAT
jgi:hypothetical protein